MVWTSVFHTTKYCNRIGIGDTGPAFVSCTAAVFVHGVKCGKKKRRNHARVGKRVSDEALAAELGI